MAYALPKNQLISAGEDSVLVFWDFNADRKEVCSINLKYNLLNFAKKSKLYQSAHLKLDKQTFGRFNNVLNTILV